MTDGIVFRPLTHDDLDGVTELERTVFSGEAWPPDLIDEELRGSWGHYVGAFLGNQLVGYAGAKGQLEIDVMTVGVLPDFQGQSIGKRLVDDLVSWAGDRTMFLEVRESNDPAIRLYEKVGFSKVGRVRGYYRAPREDAITMRRL